MIITYVITFALWKTKKNEKISTKTMHLSGRDLSKCEINLI